MRTTSVIALLASGTFLLACSAPNAPGAAEGQSESQRTKPAHEGHERHQVEGALDVKEARDGHDSDEGHDRHDVHGAHHAHAAATGIDPDHVRWSTDAPLREGMRRMRDAIHAIGDHESGHPDQEQVLKAATEVDRAAAFMFANCQLEAAPDIALHGLLARLMAGAQELRQDPDDAAALAPMRAALVDYTRLFDDPTFLNAPTNGDGGS